MLNYELNVIGTDNQPNSPRALQFDDSADYAYDKNITYHFRM